jgi:hypothetical protein
MGSDLRLLPLDVKPRSSNPMLGTRELAFVRAWAEGIDPVIAWERFLYLDGAGDARSARRELARLREELRRVARLNGRPDIAALLCRDPEAIVERNVTCLLYTSDAADDM